MLDNIKKIPNCGCPKVGCHLLRDACCPPPDLKEYRLLTDEERKIADRVLNMDLDGKLAEPMDMNSWVARSLASPRGPFLKGNPVFPMEQQPLNFSDYQWLQNLERILYERIWEHWGYEYAEPNPDFDDSSSEADPSSEASAPVSNPEESSEPGLPTENEESHQEEGADRFEERAQSLEATSEDPSDSTSVEDDETSDDNDWSTIDSNEFKIIHIHVPWTTKMTSKHLTVY